MRARIAHALTCAIVTVALVGGSASLAGAAPTRSVTTTALRITARASLPESTGRLIVRMKGATPAEKVARLKADAGVSAEQVRKLNADQYSVRPNAGQSLAALQARLEASDQVAYAEPDYIRHLTYTPASYVAPNDPAFNDSSTYTSNTGGTYANGKSWWLRSVGISDVWPAVFTGPAIANRYPVRADASAFKIGVIDTGFYLNHPDRGNISAGWDLCETYSSTTGIATTDGDVTPAPASAPGNDEAQASHGTCTAGEIAAATNNGVGTVGAGYDAQVLVYKVLGTWIEGDANNPPGSAIIPDSAVIAAIRRAADDGCRIISMSLGGYEYSQAEKDAVDYARSKGALVVAAVGNDGVSNPFYPAGYSGVVGVGSYELSSLGYRIRSSFSNYGSQVDLMGPGNMIYGLADPTWDADGAGPVPAGYRWWAGTSMATPAVAASLSLLWRMVPALSADEVAAFAQSSAIDMGAVGYDTSFGYGVFDAVRSYAALTSAYPLLARTSVTVASVAYAADVPVFWQVVAGRGVTYDVALDGVTVASGLNSTRHILRGVGNGAHTVTVTPRSPYNWGDGSEAVSAGFTVAATRATPLASIVRLWGADRYTTNQAAVRSGWASADTVVLVSGEVWPDALSAAPLARAYGAPVVVTRTKSLSASARDEIARLKARNVVIVGGPNSVSLGVQSAVSAMGVSVSRVYGSDRYRTAEAVALQLASFQGGRLSEGSVIVASGESFADALVSSAVAARRGWPILLAHQKGAPASTVAAFSAMGGSHAVVVGRYSTLTSIVDRQFPNVERVSGANQYAVPVTLANWATSHYPASFDGASIALVSATAWADGLSAGSLGSLDGSLVLVTPKSLAAETGAYLRANKASIVRLSAVGGPVSVTDSALNTARSILQ